MRSTYILLHGLLIIGSMPAQGGAAPAQSANTAPQCQAITLPVSASENNYVISLTVSPVELNACTDKDGDSISIVSVSAPGQLSADGRIIIPYPDKVRDTIRVPYVVSDTHGDVGASTIVVKLR